MALKLYKEDGQSNPSFKYEDDATPPSGYTETDDPIDWDNAWRNTLRATGLTFFSEFRAKLKTGYDAVGTPSADQKKVASEWFVVDKSVRDTVHSSAEQEAFAVEFAENCSEEFQARVQETTKDSVKDADEADVTEGVENGTQKKGTLVFIDEAIAVNLAGRSILSTNSQSYISFSGTGAVDDAGFAFPIPSDYIGGLNFWFGWVMDGTSADQGRIALNLVKSADLGKADNASTDETIEILDDGQATTAWLIQTSPKGESGLTWSPGEVCSLEIERDPSHINDTLADTMYLKFLVVEYLRS